MAKKRKHTPEPRVLRNEGHLEDTIDVEEADASLDTNLREDTAPFEGEIPWNDEQVMPLSIAFAGGKGGAGRSLLVANIGLYLSRLGRDVVVADLDPGGSNLHTYLGLSPLLSNAGAMLRDPGPPRVEEIAGMSLRLCRSPVPGCRGSDDPLRLATMEKAKSLGADVLIMDLGTQLDELTLDAFLNADAGVVVVLPEPVAVERAYVFLRSALYRCLHHGDDEPAVVARAVLSADQVGQLDSPADLVAALSGVHANAAEAIRARTLAFTPKILMNRCRSRSEREMEAGIVSALKRRFGINAEALGGVATDDAAWEATRRRRNVMLEYPGSALGGDIERVARKLMSLSAIREQRS